MNVENNSDRNAPKGKAATSKQAAGPRGVMEPVGDGDGLANDQNEAAETTGQAPQLPKIISFSALARCGDEIWIENNGQIYRLRRTKQDKLILTK
jgi:hemin uptake protein HemP